MAGRVEVDTRELERGLRQLSAGISTGIAPAAAKSANVVAGRLRPLVPVRSGRLRATVSVSKTGNGATVHYGGTLPYARYIDRRTGATARATANAGPLFSATMHALGAHEVGRL